MGACESPYVGEVGLPVEGRTENAPSCSKDEASCSKDGRQSDGEDHGVDTAELHFLILHYLKGGPCKQTAAVLEEVRGHRVPFVDLFARGCENTCQYNRYV